MAKRAVFLDKDGTLVENVPFNVKPEVLVLCPGAVEAMRMFRLLGYSLYVISNQPGVAFGYFQEEAVISLFDYFLDMLKKKDAFLDGYYYCPHHPHGVVSRYSKQCECRKPYPGLLYRAARENGCDLSQSWFVGDILNDVEAGMRAGCRTILLNTGHETEWDMTPPFRRPSFFAYSLTEAASLVDHAESA